MNAHKNISPAASALPAYADPVQPSRGRGESGKGLGQPRMIFPVYGFAADARYRREVVASFFDLGAATDMVLHPTREGFEQRELYIGHPKYRATVRLVHSDVQDAGNGWSRVAL